MDNNFSTRRLALNGVFGFSVSHAQFGSGGGNSGNNQTGFKVELWEMILLMVLLYSLITTTINGVAIRFDVVCQLSTKNLAIHSND